MLKGSYYRFVPYPSKDGLHILVSFAELPHVPIGVFNPAQQTVEINGKVLTKVRAVDPLTEKKIPPTVNAFGHTFVVGKRLQPSNPSVPHPIRYQLLLGAEKHPVAILEFPLDRELNYDNPIVTWAHKN
jgi:hypothetical protein